MNAVAARVRDISAMLLIGDGIAAMIAPKARPAIWKAGPPPWKDLMEIFERRPRAVFAVGLLEVLIGAAIVRRVAADRQARLEAEAFEPIAGPGSHG